MGDYCYSESTSESCEAVDVVAVSNGELNTGWGQDGAGDCVWVEESASQAKCQIKYK